MAPKAEQPSRADRIRARRKIEPIRRKPIPRAPEQTAEREAKAASRVVSRRIGSHAQPISHATSTQSRRTIYIPTGTPGKEIRLPAIPRVRIGWRIVSGLLSLALIGIMVMFLRSDSFKVNPGGIDIRGNYRVTREEIATKLSEFGTLIIEVKPEDIERDIIRDFRDIKSARVSVSLPANLNVRVQERIPAILWLVDATEENEAKQVWIDQEGHSFAVRGEATLPIEVHANVDPPAPFAPDRSESDDDDSEEEKVFTGYPPDVDPRMILAIQTLNGIKPEGTILRFDARRGLGWQDPSHGWMVYFGRSADHLSVKMAQYQKIADLLLERNLQPSLISLEYLHAPYYR